MVVLTDFQQDAPGNIIAAVDWCRFTEIAVVTDFVQDASLQLSTDADVLKLLLSLIFIRMHHGSC